MNENDIELRTLPRPRKNSKQSNKLKRLSAQDLGLHSSLISNPMAGSAAKPSSPPPVESQATSKRGGIRDWLFGKSNKTGKPVKKQVNNNYHRHSVDHAGFSDETDSGLTDSGDFSQRRSYFLTAKQNVIRGHLFEQHQGPTWCDYCEDFIWGIYRSFSARCKFCKYTCHARCLADVDLDCPKAPAKVKSLEDLTKETLDILNETTGKQMIEKDLRISLPSYVTSISQLRSMIEEYNKDSSLIMTLQDDGTFHGFVRVNMNMKRPVNVSSDTKNLTMKRAISRSNSRRSRRTASMSSTSSRSSTMTSMSSVSSTESESLTISSGARRLTRRLSFYMPKGTSKPLHITSSTTSIEVIEALLDKYQVTDNPRKFALYERTEEDNQFVLRKMADDERPLVLSLLWGVKAQKSTFCLQENETGDIMWDAFELPELRNFLMILNKEEADMIGQIKQKYRNYKRLLNEALQHHEAERKDSSC